MENENSRTFRFPFYVILLTVLMLFSISNIPEDAEVFVMSIKGFNLFSDFPDVDIESNNIVPPEKAKNPLILKAGIMPELELYENGFSYQNIDELIKQVKIEGNTDQLKYFLEALKNSGSSVVRIAHIGDSIIEGDYVTAEFRRILQQKFGGKGVGFLSVTSMDTKFRLTSNHRFSDDWQTFSLFGKKSKKYSYSLNGEVFIPSEGSTASYELRKDYKSSSEFSVAKILFSGSGKSKVTITINDKNKEDINLTEASGITEAVKNLDKSAVKAEFKFKPSESLTVTGISLESNSGIIIDNYPYRGNTGAALSELSENSLKELNKLQNYKLIVLQFGLNAVAMKKSDYSDFKKKFSEGIKLLKKSFPETSIIMMGVSDKSAKKGSAFVTDPVIKDLIDMQKEISKETNIAFWNTFEAMGGQNSMVKWVKNKPAYAHSDFTHFNKTGADKIGEMLAKTLIEKYAEYTK